MDGVFVGKDNKQETNKKQTKNKKKTPRTTFIEEEATLPAALTSKWRVLNC